MEQLFGSKTRVKLLKLFLSNPNRSFYVREITRKVEEQINSVRRELSNLLNIGILKSEEKDKDNKLYYEVNQSYEHYDALRSVFGNVKMVEKEDGKKSRTVSTKGSELGGKLKDLGQVDVLIYLGSFTGDQMTGVDVFMVGDINKTKAHNFMVDLEDEEGRELKYTVISTDEYLYRKDVNDRFVGQIMDAKKTVLHDPNGLLDKN